MKKYLPLFALLGFIPYLVQVPYILNAWNYSQLDRFDWIFLAAFALSALLNIKRLLNIKFKRDVFAYAALGLFAILFAAGVVTNIHAVAIAGAVMFAWAAVWIFFGWRGAFAMLPAFTLLMLGTTSSTYWISFLFSCQIYGALAAKFTVAGALLIFDCLSRRYNWLLRRSSLCYLGALTLAGLLLFQSGNPAGESEPFLLEIDKLRFEDYLGREMPLDESTKRFFNQNEVRQFNFANDAASFGVLSIKCFGGIHEIHPASHCLRSSGAQIWAEHSSEEIIDGVKLRVSEIVAAAAGGRILVWVWYSNDRMSTGDFLGFRRAWKPGDRWYTFQISTPANDLDRARAAMKEFLSELHKTNPGKSVKTP